MIRERESNMENGSTPKWIRIARFLLTVGVVCGSCLWIVASMGGDVKVNTKCIEQNTTAVTGLVATATKQREDLHALELKQVKIEGDISYTREKVGEISTLMKEKWK